jgi:mono/diheme cytochrome c family protein
LCLTAATLGFAQVSGRSAAGQKPAPGSPPPTADSLEGKKLFIADCAACHYSSSRAKKIGPGLKDLSKRGKFSDGKPVDEASLRAWIDRGGKNMPPFKDSLNAEQKRQLMAYLKTL